MANPTTNYAFAMPTNTDLVKDLPADFEIFGQAVDTQMKTNADAAIAKTIVDAKGDIIAATAADTVARLAVGANDTILTADSSTATGLKWAAPAAAGGMTLLSTTTLSGATTTISSISGAYKDLIVIGYGLNATNSTQPYIQPNASNIADFSIATTYGSTLAVENFRTTSMVFTGGQNLASGNADNGFQIHFSQYANTSISFKPFSMVSRVVSTASPSTMTLIGGGSINTSSAISSLVVGVGSGTVTGTILIYGVN